MSDLSVTRPRRPFLATLKALVSGGGVMPVLAAGFCLSAGLTRLF
ncbi:MAG TPA: hypothetical protein VEB20_17960 [Azospirillaceae bacterium]|nr:hypothetical protein [Azospirillaceae bacterium]